MSGPKRISASGAVLAQDVLDDGDGVRRGHAVVGQRLDLGRRVDVHDGDRAGVLGLPGAQLLGRDRVGQRAAGVEVGDQDGLLGREDRGRLGHEVHAAEGDDVGVGGGRLLAEAERVAHVVGDVLDLGQLVVVGEDHRVALARRARAPRPAGAGCPRGRAAAAGSRSGPWAGSRQRLQEKGEVECGGGVREGTHRDELYARARDVPDRLERHAAAGLELRAAVDVRDDLAQLRRASCCRAAAAARRAASASSTSADVAALDLERDVRRAPRARPRPPPPTPPAIAAWFSLMRIAS